MFLQPQNGISKQTPHQAEEQHGEGVLHPVLFPFGVHAHHPVSQALAGPEQGIEPGFPACIQDLAEIEAHRFGDGRQDGHIAS